jgi:hypothetical protein
MTTAMAAMADEPSRCWMCENCTADDMQHLHTYMIDQAHNVDAREMAAHMHEHLSSSLASSVLGDNPPTEEDILNHIKKHILHPSIRVAQILRNLLNLADTLQELVVSRSDDGLPLIDVQTVTVYLKVVSEIMQIYKTADISKMLFADKKA